MWSIVTKMHIITFMNLFMESMVTMTPTFMQRITARCRPYAKGVKTQDTPTAKNFEQHVNFIAYDVLRRMGVDGYPAVCEYMSDTSIETDSCIIQLDAKACMNTESSEFLVKKDVLQIHCGIAQTSLSSICKKQAVKGLQVTEIDGKPVYTLLSFLRWGYKEKYFAESIGIAMIPHDQTMVKERAGKSSHELRLLLLDPKLWIVHSYEPQSVLRIGDLTQSESTSDSETEQPAQ
jgi:hypothetical protein